MVMMVTMMIKVTYVVEPLTAGRQHGTSCNEHKISGSDSQFRLLFLIWSACVGGGEWREGSPLTPHPQSHRLDEVTFGAHKRSSACARYRRIDEEVCVCVCVVCVYGLLTACRRRTRACRGSNPHQRTSRRGSRREGRRGKTREHERQPQG